ncbi:hypothetical protein GF374_03440 [Candidatus Woesearchaeota archaeon]|nr:hypothetical protein [Candidatus Woesearchaeota archaeon]
MAFKLVVKVKRVKKGDSGTRPVVVGGYTGGTFPSDGYVVSTNEPGNSPAFVRDSDLERAKKTFEKKKKSVSIEAESWGKGEEDGQSE